MNTLCLQLLEATVTLYPANADDSPQTDAPIWSGAPAENLRLPEKWIKRQTRPSGAAYPVNHPLIPEYEITIGRVWVLETANLAGWQTGAGRYVLDITWVEAETLDWHRQTYYGVTVSERGQDARDVENGFLENQVFDAQYCVPAGGPAGSLPPLLPAAVPSTVVYTDATGSLTLYAYNATTGVFTAAADPAGRATVTNSPFAIQFAGDAGPVVTVAGNTLVYRPPGFIYRNANSYRQFGLGTRGIFAAPATQLPRLDFYYGSQRVFTVTRCGIFDTDFTELPAAGPLSGGFTAYGAGGSVVAVFTALNLAATRITVTA